MRTTCAYKGVVWASGVCLSDEDGYSTAHKIGRGLLLRERPDYNSNRYWQRDDAGARANLAGTARNRDGGQRSELFRPWWRLFPGSPAVHAHRETIQG